MKAAGIAALSIALGMTGAFAGEAGAECSAGHAMLMTSAKPEVTVADVQQSTQGPKQQYQVIAIPLDAALNAAQAGPADDALKLASGGGEQEARD
jgi:hypothetical protein